MERKAELNNTLQGIIVGMDSKHEILTDFDTTGYTAIATTEQGDTTVTLKDKDANENVLVLPYGMVLVIGHDVKTITTDVVIYIA